MGRPITHPGSAARWASTLALLLALQAGCLDVRDFEGTWRGARVGESPALRQGFADAVNATLTIEDIDLRDMRARLSVDGLIDDQLVEPIPGAEADALSTMSFDGSPARVFLAFVPTTDSAGDALVVVALYDDPRVTVRVLRGGQVPLYGVFSLARGGL